MRKIGEVLREKSFYRSLVYLLALIFHITTVAVIILYCSSIGFGLLQLILFGLAGFVDCFIFIEFLKVVEDNYQKTEER